MASRLCPPRSWPMSFRKGSHNESPRILKSFDQTRPSTRCMGIQSRKTLHTPALARQNCQPRQRIHQIQVRWHTKPAEGSSKYRELQLDPSLAYIALGSNVGNRLKNIEDALHALRDAGLSVQRTSGLYETAPMYVEDQDVFLNAACEVVIPEGMTPHQMLTKLKTLEDQLGRRKTIDKGPRSIDLDILLFGREKLNAPDLVIPHHSMLEREFVLRPLADLIPSKELAYPRKRGKYAAVSWYLNSLPQEIDSKVYPLRSSKLRPETPTRRTRLMAVMNMTPDSFSDGGKNSVDPSDVGMQQQLQDWLRAGVEIIDIGGQSTRPNAQPVTAEDEIARVVPLVKSLRSQKEFDGVSISVDTFRAAVARAAIEAGADIVNDVSAGQLDPDMLQTVATLQCPIMLMHMRGDPTTMSKMCDYPDGLISGIANELSQRVEEAEKAGIPRWRIILDPGIGFAKKGYQNVEILKRLEELRDWPKLRGFPWVVGASRKRFIGEVTKVRAAAERDWGTAAAVTAGIQGGADIVRVHNSELQSTIKMADAIYRNPTGESTLV